MKPSFPYPGHRTMAEVMADEARRAILLPAYVRNILNEAANHAGVTIRALVSSTRTARICRARHAAMLALRRRGLSYPKIARILGRRDHTTVIHGVRRAIHLRSAEPDFAELCERLAA